MMDLTCPYCGSDNKQAVCVNSKHREEPKPGDVVVCYVCFNVCIVDESYCLKTPGPRDIDKVLEAQFRVAEIVRKQRGIPI